MKRNPYRDSRKEARKERASGRRPKQKESHYQEGDGHYNEQASLHETEQQYDEESDEFSENERYDLSIYEEFGDVNEEKSDPGQDKSIDSQLEENDRTRRDNVACHRDDQYSPEDEGHLRVPRVRFAGSAESVEEESAGEDYHIWYDRLADLFDDEAFLEEDYWVVMIVTDREKKEESEQGNDEQIAIKIGRISEIWSLIGWVAFQL